MKKQNRYVSVYKLGLMGLLFLFSCTKPFVDFGPLYSDNACLGCGLSFSNSIYILNSSFSPDTLTVKKGEAITWSNTDAIEHIIIPDNNNGPSSGIIPAGGQYQYTPGTTGSFRYQCGLHGEWAVVIVTL